MYIVEEVDVPEEAPSVHVSGHSTDTFLASFLYGSKRKGKKNQCQRYENELKMYLTILHF